MSLRADAVKYAGFFEKFPQSGRGLRPGGQRSLKGFPLLFVQPKTDTVRKGFIRTRQSTFENKLAHRSVQSAGCDLEGTLCGRSEAKVQLFVAKFGCLPHCLPVYQMADNVMTTTQEPVGEVAL